MTKLQKSLRLMLLTAAPLATPAWAQIQPQDLPAQQAQTQAQVNQQNSQTQLNNLQQQQNMTQDRLREQQLFAPRPYGAATPYVVRPPSPAPHVAPAPPAHVAPAPKPHN